MHNYKRLPMISFGRKVLGAAVASSLLLLSNAQATGLGRLTVLSALGQPLRAEIELTSPNKDEVSSLVPKLASVDAFKQASIDFNPALLSMRFSIEPRGAGYVIRLTSTQAMNEPFVDLLLEMNSSGGRLLREYTFLLDPAELRGSQSAQVANPVNIAIAPPAMLLKQQNIQADVAVSAIKKSTVAKVKDSSTGTSEKSDYKIKPGDTLSRVAGVYKNEGISLDQMLVSLYKANPQAFSGNNMNRLRVGQILSVPDADINRSTSIGESHMIVMAHATDFNLYRNKMAGQVADSSSTQKIVTSKQNVSGTITANVKEVPSEINDALDKLKLSKASPGGTLKSGVEKVSVEEDRVAKNKAIVEANARVKELEKNVNDLNKLLKIKDKDLAEKQGAATAKIDTKIVSAKPMLTSSTASLSVDNSSASSVAALDTSRLVASSVATKQASVSVAGSTPKRKPVAPPEPGFFDGMMDNGFVLPIGILVALAAGFGIFSSRRKKKFQQFDDSILTGSSMKANSMFGSTGGQSVDTNNSVFNSNFAPSASQLDANEVDPIAEADVYIAYGRDSQAEEILKEALRTQPDRHAVRVKLLEIYFNRKDPRSFERLASELYGMTSGEGEEWVQAASLGVVLEPTNPLYAGGEKRNDTHIGSGLGASTQPLEELDPEALLGNSLSEDMLESISIVDTASGLTDDAISTQDSTNTKASDAESFDIGSLDFDLDIPNSEAADQFGSPLLPENLARSQKIVNEDSVVDFGTIDFQLNDNGIVLDSLGTKVVDSTKVSVSTDQTNVNEIAFESASTSGMLTNSAFIEALPHLDSTDVLDQQDVKLGAQIGAFEFDLSGINLDLNSKDVELELTPEEKQTYNAEMATKLDLAVAYHEIGDKEGARELLDEVLKGGTLDQIEKAKNMLIHLM